MKKQVYTFLSQNTDIHWWHLGRNKIMYRLVNLLGIPAKGNILELGVGTGDFLAGLSYNKKFGIDFYEYQRDREGFKFIQADVNRLPIRDNSIDLLLMLDILEHIEQDEDLLKRSYDLLKKNGKMVIFAPALQVLWSDWDELNMHFRRYTLKSLDSIIKTLPSGYRVIKRSYANFFLFVPILVCRVVQKVVKKLNKNYDSSAVERPDNLVNGLLKHIFAMESFFLSFMNFPIGVSCLLVIEKT